MLCMCGMMFVIEWGEWAMERRSLLVGPFGISDLGALEKAVEGGRLYI